MSAPSNAPPVKDWQVGAVKFLAPRINKSGGKAISIISTQTNRVLAVPTPMMRTWGVDDFENADGTRDGKYSMSLNFPHEEDATPATAAFLEKLQAFENMILDAAVENSVAWLGKKKSRESCEDSFKPFLKYPKDKNTKEVDLSRPPTVRPKVPCYDGVWNIEIFDTRMKALFPASDPSDGRTPIDWVPSQSNVACVLQCGGIWSTGMGWGVTWKVTQCVVKPRDVQSVYGVCQIELSDADRAGIEGDAEPEPVPVPALKAAAPPQRVAAPAPAFDTQVPDSDDEAESAPESVSEPTPDAEPELVPAAPKPTVAVRPAAPKVAAPKGSDAAQPAAEPAAKPAAKLVPKKAPAPAEDSAAAPAEAPKKKKIMVKAPVI